MQLTRTLLFADLLAWPIVVLVNAGVYAIFLCFVASPEKCHRGFNKGSNKAHINNVCRAIYVYL